MGMIKIVTTKNAVSTMNGYKNAQPNQMRAAISHVSFQVYEKPVVPGYRKVQVKN